MAMIGTAQHLLGSNYLGLDLCFLFPLVWAGPGTDITCPGTAEKIISNPSV